MPRALLLAMFAGLAFAGCGDDERSPALPAAATDTTVQPAAAAPVAVSPASDEAAGLTAAAGDDSSPKKAQAKAAKGKAQAGSGVLRGTFKRLNGAGDDLSRYRGRVVLVVNTATECGYTPQFEGLEALYRARRDDGLVVLGFPANDFAGQEPRSDDEIATFCKANYGVSFPMFSKTHVLGAGANPLYQALTTAAGEPEWNFNKYLVDRRGRVVARFGAGTEPDASELTRRLDSLL